MFFIQEMPGVGLCPWQRDRRSLELPHGAEGLLSGAAALPEEDTAEGVNAHFPDQFFLRSLLPSFLRPSSRTGHAGQRRCCHNRRLQCRPWAVGQPPETEEISGSHKQP